MENIVEPDYQNTTGTMLPREHEGPKREQGINLFSHFVNGEEHLHYIGSILGKNKNTRGIIINFVA